jgi:hypothetical protein
MAAINSNGGNRWNILGLNFTKRDALSSVQYIRYLWLVQKGHFSSQKGTALLVL